MGTRIMKALEKLVAPLAPLLILLYLFGGIVSGVWLAYRGDWWALGYGLIGLYFSTFALGIALLPTLILAPPAVHLSERRIRSGTNPSDLLVSLYTMASSPSGACSSSVPSCSARSPIRSFPCCSGRTAWR
jgi:hypothetical protein